MYEGVSKSRTGRLERELQMVQLSATRCSCIAILWVSIVIFAAITLCGASQRVLIAVSAYFFIDSVRKLLDTPSYGTRRFITVFIRARRWSLCWARCIKCTPSHPISLRSILIWSSNTRLGLTSFSNKKVLIANEWTVASFHIKDHIKTYIYVYIYSCGSNSWHKSEHPLIFVLTVAYTRNKW
jgi:hypothetical protein